MSFKLGKPPIARAWVTATFEPIQDDTASVWDWDLAENVLRGFKDLPELEKLSEQKFEIIRQAENGKRGQGRLASEIQSLRVRNEETTKIVQLEPNRLTVTSSREPGGRWRGSQHLLAEFQAALEMYVAKVSASTIAQLELHHVDIVEISNPPVQENNIVLLRDLFQGAPEFPVPEFGHTIDVGWHATFTNPDDTTKWLIMAIEYMPSDEARKAAEIAAEQNRPSRREFRFQLDWHSVCNERIDLDDSMKNAVAARLSALNEMAKVRFCEVCKPIWHQFDPEETT